MEISRRRTLRKSGFSKRCGFSVRRRCRGGRRGRSKRRSMKFVSALTCIAKVKKVRWHTKFGDIEVVEPLYRLENRRIRPFLRSAKVVHRSCSRPLQRAIVDFAADQ